MLSPPHKQDAAVAEAGGTFKSLVVTRHSPIMTPNRHILAQLLDPHSKGAHTHTHTTAAAAAATSTGSGSTSKSRAAAARHWRDGVRAINDVLLRRHFTMLTRAFLS
eukprot:18141-Heterococcus_DN1.PRE.1